MSSHLREMALASLESLVNYMKTYSGGNDFKGDNYTDGQYIIIPMLNLRCIPMRKNKLSKIQSTLRRKRIDR